MSKVKLVFAAGWDWKDQPNVAFGLNNALPWGHLKEDLKSFKKNTEGTVLLMGANTFKSLPAKLKGRLHVVMCSTTQGLKTRDGSPADQVIHGGSLSNAISFLQVQYPDQDISIIGGKRLILEALDQQLADEIYFNILHPKKDLRFDYDVSFDRIQLAFDQMGYVEVHDRKFNMEQAVEHPLIEMIVEEIWKKDETN